MFSDKKKNKKSWAVGGHQCQSLQNIATEEMMELECSMKIFLRTSSISQIFCKENLKKTKF